MRARRGRCNNRGAGSQARVLQERLNRLLHPPCCPGETVPQTPASDA